MNIQNEKKETKLFISDNIINSDNFSVVDNEKICTISMKEKIQVGFINSDTFYPCIDSILFIKDSNNLSLINDKKVIIAKGISFNEILNINLDINTLIIETYKNPMFVYENNFNGQYPKFDISVSDCIYNMKIFINESILIDVPWTQTHDDMVSTLNHISNVVNYFSVEDSKFLENLCTHKTMQVTIRNENTGLDEISTLDYKIEQQGVILFNEEFENGAYPVHWQKLFKLVSDKTWNVVFIEEAESEENEDQNTEAQMTEEVIAESNGAKAYSDDDIDDEIRYS